MSTWIQEDMGAEGQTKRELHKPAGYADDDGSPKIIVLGVLAFCGLMGFIDYYHGHSASYGGVCVESDANVCCGGVSHPLIIQDEQTVKLGSKSFSPDEIKLLK